MKMIRIVAPWGECETMNKLFLKRKIIFRVAAQTDDGHATHGYMEMDDLSHEYADAYAELFRDVRGALVTIHEQGDRLLFPIALSFPGNPSTSPAREAVFVTPSRRKQVVSENGKSNSRSLFDESSIDYPFDSPSPVRTLSKLPVFKRACKSVRKV